MPVITPIIQSQLTALFSNSNNQGSQVASQLISSVLSGASSVQKILGGAVVPFMPVGASASIAMLSTLFSNSNNQPSQVASQIATAISLIDPTIPPVQLSTLQAQLTALFSNSNNQSSQVASQIATAITLYIIGSGICI